ncbi:RCC1/BLIP-II [Hypoxylon sp. FL1150]|nr:RCC1/BLIP-II [Hypoxylon sp. FL1150]
MPPKSPKNAKSGGFSYFPPEDSEEKRELLQALTAERAKQNGLDPHPPKSKTKKETEKQKKARREQAKDNDHSGLEDSQDFPSDPRPEREAHSEQAQRTSKPTKRKRDGNEEGEKSTAKPQAKKPRAASKPNAHEAEPSKKPPAPKKTRAPKPVSQKTAGRPATKPTTTGSSSRSRRLGARGAVINDVPSTVLDVFVFGEGSSGELGLGSKKYDGKKPIDVKRPRINHNLKDVVAIACGGMHCIALTSEQVVLTWGVNDDKALGRDTLWEGGTRDIEDEDSDIDDLDDTGINPRESTPGEVDLGMLDQDTKIVQVAATDSASFILTDDGWVYGWGTFRGSDGIIGFSEGVRTQSTPTIIPGLRGIVQLACGSNHVLALDAAGKVFTWGSGGQFQLGRKPLSRLGGPSAGLIPQACGRFSSRHRAIHVSAGSYHSFYIDDSNHVWAWGLNNYAQTGLNENTGEDDAMVLQPQVVESLEGYKISQIVGGEHHSVACTKDGELLTWGRVDGHQVGQPSTLYTEENAVFDDNGKPRILARPTAIDGVEKANFIATGTDTSFALDEAGKVYSWGFSANYQTGQGTIDDIEVPTVIDNTAIRDRRIVWAGAGGQFSMIAAVAGDED